MRDHAEPERFGWTGLLHLQGVVINPVEHAAQVHQYVSARRSRRPRVAARDVHLFDLETRLTSHAAWLLMSQLERGPLLTEQACACPDEQGANPPARTRKPRTVVIESDSWLASGSMVVEEVVMSGSGEGPQQFGVHRCSLGTEKKY